MCIAVKYGRKVKWMICKLLVLKNYECEAVELNSMSFGAEEWRQKCWCELKEGNGNQR
jgi:hypothetical protein